MGMDTPNLGSTMPTMGKALKPPRSEAAGDRISMTAALFTSTQRRVLGLLFGQPDRSFYATEIIRTVGSGSGAVQRELARLSGSGLLRVSRVGNQKHYQANPDAPIYPELCSLVRKTMGLAEPLRSALTPLREDLELALVFGSIAKGTSTAKSDVDLLLVSDSLTLEEVYTALAPVEETLSRQIHPTLYTADEYGRRRASGSTFLQRVLAGDTIVLFGATLDDPPGESGAHRPAED